MGEDKTEEKTFIEKTQPVNILDVINQKLLEQPLDSPHFLLEKPVTICPMTRTMHEDMEALKTAHNLLKTSLRALGHEVNQLNFGLEGIRKTHLSGVARMRYLDEKKLDDIQRDIMSYFGHLNLLFKQATQAVSEPPKPDKTEFWAYREILFKWEDMYRMNARLKSLEFDICRTRAEDLRRPPVYGDKNLLEQLVYTLVSNAIKYCHEGTKIHLDCVKETSGKKDSPHILTVTNYGRKLNCERPFELGTRGENVIGVGGLGIGLYSAKRIADAHNASLEYSCEKVSDYNVPLIELYIREKTNDKNDLLMPELKNEMDRLKKLKIYDEVVSKSKIMLGEESRPDENKKLKDITEKLKEILKLKAYNKIVNEINSMLLEESKSERYQPTKVRVYHPIKEEIAAFIKEATYKVIFTLTIPARRA